MSVCHFVRNVVLIYDLIPTRIYVDVEQSLLVTGNDGVQDPPTRPRILIGRLDDSKCVRRHANVPRDVVNGANK